MSLPETVSFDKEGRIEGHPSFRSILHKLFLPLIIILVGLLGFGVGRLTSVGEGSAVTIEYDEALADLMSPDPHPRSKTETATALNSLPQNGLEVVASKNGSKYHYSYCGSAKQIKEENRITFKSAAEAEASGYTLAGNCQKR